MAAGDQYQLDIDSVQTLIGAWKQGADETSKICRQLAEIHNQLAGSVASALVTGSAEQVALGEVFDTLAAAVSAADNVAQGLAQDTSTLNANLRAYVAVEDAVEAKLKAVQGVKSVKPVKPAKPTHGIGAAAGGSAQGSTHTSGSGSASASGGGASHVGGGGGGGGGAGARGSDSSGNGLQPPGPASYANRSQVQSWINQAFKVLEADGVPASELNEAGVLMIIEHESSGNPNAINNWDSNAKAGDPSRGLMQVIGTTFSAYQLPGHGNIYNPVDNIIAGVRYALSRYGSIQNVPGVRSVNSGGSYVGY